MRRFTIFWNIYRFTIFWAVITLVFLSLTIFSITQFKTVSNIENKLRVAKVMDVPTIAGAEDFVGDINKFVDEFNHINQTSNIATCIGLSVTTATAFVSCILSLSESISKKKGKEISEEST